MPAEPHHLAGDKLYVRVLDILDGHRPGHAMPILRALARRGHPPAQCYLADLLSDNRNVAFYRPSLALRWYHRAARNDGSTALYNLAVTYRNAGKMRQYRYWLARAARSHPDYRAELKSFKVRFPHEIMKAWHRYNGLADPYA